MMEKLDTTSYFKSVKYILPLFVMLLGLSYCSPTETVTEAPDDEEEEVVEVTVKPEWYDNSVSSRADSVFFYGYSHASASDSTEAIELAEEMAQVNLRFEIDKFTDEHRASTADSTGSELYNSAEFIIALRNVIQDLELSGAEAKTDVHEADNGVFHAFTEVKTEKDYIINDITAMIDDTVFTDSLAD